MHSLSDWRVDVYKRFVSLKIVVPGFYGGQRTNSTSRRVLCHLLRLATFEGQKHLSKEETVVGMPEDCRTSLQRCASNVISACNRLAEHVKQVLLKREEEAIMAQAAAAAVAGFSRLDLLTGTREAQPTRSVSSMHVYFRPDRQDRIWLQWCGSCNISSSAVPEEAGAALMSYLLSPQKRISGGVGKDMEALGGIGTASMATASASSSITATDTEDGREEVNDVDTRSSIRVRFESPHMTTPRRAWTDITEGAADDVRMIHGFRREMGELLGGDAEGIVGKQRKGSSPSSPADEGKANSKKKGGTSKGGAIGDSEDEPLSTADALLRGLPLNGRRKRVVPCGVCARGMCAEDVEEHNKEATEIITFAEIITFHDRLALREGSFMASKRTHFGKPPALPTQLIPVPLQPCELFDPVRIGKV